MDQTLHIKNMVCDRCITTVEQILKRNKMPFSKISLGEVVLEKKITPGEKMLLQDDLKQVGFELVADRNEKLVTKIKAVIIQSIYKDHDVKNKNLSQVLIENLPYDYSYLSFIFSRLEGRSIQAFQSSIKIERIKELLEYDEKSISEIADDLNFGNATYLSTSFKKATGLTPSQYRLQKINLRNTLNSL